MTDRTPSTSPTPPEPMSDSSLSGSAERTKTDAQIVLHAKMVEGLTPRGREALAGILDAIMALFSKQQQGLPLTIEDLAYPKTLIGERLCSPTSDTNTVAPPDSKVIWTTNDGAPMSDTPSRVSPSATADDIRADLEESLEQIITDIEAMPGDSWNAPAPSMMDAIKREMILIRTLFRTLEDVVRRSPDIESTFGVGDYANNEIPASRGSEEEFGKLLDAWERTALMEPLPDDYDNGPEYDPSHRSWEERLAAERQAVESYVSRLRDERREEIAELKSVIQGYATVNESLRAALASLKEQQLTKCPKCGT